MSDKLGEKAVYFSQSLIKYLTCLIIEAHDSPRAVRYVGVLGGEIKGRSDVLHEGIICY